MLPLAVRADSFIHAAHRGRLPGVHLRLSAAGAPAGPGGAEALAGAPGEQLALELVDRAEDMEDQPPGRRGRVHVLLSASLDRDQVAAWLGWRLRELYPGARRAGHHGGPVQPLRRG
jgi:hypothetical protein